jgi:hypothetical protein
MRFEEVPEEFDYNKYKTEALEKIALAFSIPERFFSPELSHQLQEHSLMDLRQFAIEQGIDVATAPTKWEVIDRIVSWHLRGK